MISARRPPVAVPLTFADLCRREPGLAQLAREIRAFTRTPLGDDWCANARWYGYGRYRGMGYRPRLVELIGWWARSIDPVVRSSRAYEVAYHELYALLPDCRRCLCAVWQDGAVVR